MSSDWHESEAKAECLDLRLRVGELERHEEQTHERLGALLGTDDSLEECAKQLLSERDALKAENARLQAIIDDAYAKHVL